MVAFKQDHDTVQKIRTIIMNPVELSKSNNLVTINHVQVKMKFLIRHLLFMLVISLMVLLLKLPMKTMMAMTMMIS